MKRVTDGDELNRVNNRVWHCVSGSASMWNYVRNHVKARVWYHVENRARARVRDRVWYSVENHVWHRVGDRVEDRAKVHDVETY